MSLWAPLFSAYPAMAARLQLPRRLAAARAEIARQCPECTRGFTACGTADVQYGKRFARTALQGRPARGYLLSFVMTGAEFRALARETVSYDELVRALQGRFRQARLVVLEEEGAAARVLPTPESVEVIFPAGLHACVRDATKPWGCCVGECSDECCEKRLGSPSVALKWTDTAAQETVAFTFHHMIGFSRLERTGHRGQVLYYCLVDHAARIE